VEEKIYKFIINTSNYEEKILELYNELYFNISNRKERVELIINGEVIEVIDKGYLFSKLTLLSPFYKYENELPIKKLDKYDLKQSGDYNLYFDDIIEYFAKKCSIDIGEDIIYIINTLNELGRLTNYNKGVSVSLKSYIDAYKRNPRLREITFFKLDRNENISIEEVIELTHQLKHETIEILKKDTECNLNPYIQSKAGLNDNQFGQVFCYIGHKPGFYEDVIPYPINTNFCRGYNDITEYLINCIGARKSLITAKTQVKNSGYLTQKLSFLTVDEKFSKTEHDCGSVFYLPVKIKNEKFLSKLSGRWFYDEEVNQLNLIDETRFDLVGKEILIRSPITCASEDGICEVCYGELHKINKISLPDTPELNIGIIATLILTNQITQKLLSTKHLLQAAVDKIEWDEIFLDYFAININNITHKEFKKFKLIIFKEDLIDAEYMRDEDKLIFNKFYIQYGKEDPIEFESPINLQVHPDLNKELMENLNNYDHELEKYSITITGDSEYDFLFTFITENNGLSRKLVLIKELIETNRYIKDESVEKIYERFIDLVEDSGITIQYIHLEIILRSMMVLTNGKTRADFRDEDADVEIELNNVKQSIFYNSNSISKSLMFEMVNKQLLTDELNTFNKDGSSILDPLLI